MNDPSFREIRNWLVLIRNWRSIRSIREDDSEDGNMKYRIKTIASCKERNSSIECYSMNLRRCTRLESSIVSRDKEEEEEEKRERVSQSSFTIYFNVQFVFIYIFYNDKLVFFIYLNCSWHTYYYLHKKEDWGNNEKSRIRNWIESVFLVSKNGGCFRPRFFSNGSLPT